MLVFVSILVCCTRLCVAVKRPCLRALQWLGMGEYELTHLFDGLNEFGGSIIIVPVLRMMDDMTDFF